MMSKERDFYIKQVLQNNENKMKQKQLDILNHQSQIDERLKQQEFQKQRKLIELKQAQLA